MTEWKLQTKEVNIKRYNKPDTKIKVSLDIQKDEKGNVLQRGGGIIPKACQECGNEFGGEQKSEDIKQKVSAFSCTKCKFKSVVADEALKHIITNDDHKLKTIDEFKTVGFKNVIDGNIAIVHKTKDDVIILCGNCNANY